MSQERAIEVWATAALREAYKVLAPQFERDAGHKVIIHWISTVDLMKRLKAGEVTDLVISTAGNIEELTRVGVLKRESWVDLAKSGVGVAVRAGTAKPDISTAEALKQTLLAAKSISYSTGPSGVYMIQLIERMGITDALKPKVKQVKGEPIGAVVARADADIGFQQISELLPVQGIDIVGPLPAEVQEITVFRAGVHIKARAPDLANTFARYVAAPAAGAVLKQTGLVPIQEST